MKIKYHDFLAIGLLILIFTTCNLTMSSNNAVVLEKAPEVSITQGGIVICLSEVPKGTEYVHLYRQEQISDDPIKYDDPVNIGIIYPKYFSNSSVCIYEDLNVFRDKTYRYFTKYHTKQNILTSYNSKEIQSLSGYNSLTDSMVYNTSDSYFVYDENTYSITIKRTVELPNIRNFDKDYTPMLLIKSNTKQQAFEISSIEEGTVILLRKTLSADFFDTEIEFAGIFGQKKVFMKDNSEDENNEVKFRIWTKPVEIEISNTLRNKITIPSDKYADGYDYGNL